MTASTTEETFRTTRTRARWRFVLTCALLALVGINLRTVILGVPPLLPLIRHDLHLSYTETGLLTSLPVLLMGSMAWPAGLLIDRIGGRAAVAFGLALLACGAALRALWPAAVPLFAFTVVLSLGIAAAQTAIPVIVRQVFPERIGLVSALFSDGLILGESIAAGITVPVVLGALGKDAWRGSFVFWSVPVIVALVLWLLFAPATAARRRAPRPSRQGAASQVRQGQRAHPARVSAWKLGVLLGSGSLIYFCMNGWIASYNQAKGASSMTAIALTVLNFAQLPVSLAVTAIAQWLAGRRAPFIVTGCICLVAIVGWVWTPTTLEPLWATLLGGSSALVFTLGIALPALLAGADEVARLTGATLTISYGLAFFGPLLGGSFWDASHIPATAFLPVAVASIVLILLGALLPSRANFGLSGASARSVPPAVPDAAPAPPAAS